MSGYVSVFLRALHPHPGADDDSHHHHSHGEDGHDHHGHDHNGHDNHDHEQDNSGVLIGNKVAGALFMLLVAALGCWLPFYLHKKLKHSLKGSLKEILLGGLMSVINAFAGGALLGLGLFHLLPEGEDQLRDAGIYIKLGDEKAFLVAFLLAFVGYALMLLLEHILYDTHGELSHGECHTHHETNVEEHGGCTAGAKGGKDRDFSETIACFSCAMVDDVLKVCPSNHHTEATGEKRTICTTEVRRTHYRETILRSQTFPYGIDRYGGDKFSAQCNRNRLVPMDAWLTSLNEDNHETAHCNHKHFSNTKLKGCVPNEHASASKNCCHNSHNTAAIIRNTNVGHSAGDKHVGHHQELMRTKTECNPKEEHIASSDVVLGFQAIGASAGKNISFAILDQGELTVPVSRLQSVGHNFDVKNKPSLWERISKSFTSLASPAFFVALSLAVHSVFEGIIVGTSTEVVAAWVNTLVIVGHKGPAGFALAAVFIRQKLCFWHCALFLGVFLIASPVGVFIGVAAMRGGKGVAGVFTAIGVGIVLYISNEIVSQELASGGIVWYRWLKFAGFLLGGAVVFAMALVHTVVGHSH